MNKVLALTGMHRSGTSLIAHWLQTCGLYIGDDLLPAYPSNPQGHFEDVHFMRFQRRILKDNGLGYLVGPHDRILLHEHDYAAAQKLIAERENFRQWGWKDPRTCLFLDFWKKLIPGLKVVVVFRHYGQVVHSLVKRDPPLTACKNLRRYVLAWQRYNQDVLRFAAKYPDDLLLVELQRVLGESENLISMINRKWDFHLEIYPVGAVFEANLLHQGNYPILSRICEMLCPSIKITYQQLVA